MAGFYQAKLNKETENAQIYARGLPKINLERFIDRLLRKAAEEDIPRAAREVFYKLVEEHGLVVYDMSGLTEYDESNRGQVVSSYELLDALQRREAAKPIDDIDFEFWETMGKESRYCVFSDDVAKAFNHAGDQNFHWLSWDLELIWLDVKELLEDVRDNGAGSQGDVGTASAKDEEPGRRSKQINFICKMAKQLGYPDLMNIPEGGKAAIKAECLKNPDLFTSNGFGHAWKEANKRKIISMQNKEKYL